MYEDHFKISTPIEKSSTQSHLQEQQPKYIYTK